MPDPTYPFGLPALRFGFGEFEPFMDEANLRDHHETHHAAYVAALNALIKDVPGLHGRTVEDLLRGLPTVPLPIREDLRREAGGHANHQFLWKILKPGPATAPTGDLADALRADFGSFEAFQERFVSAALELPVDGWVFLVVDPKDGGRLKIHAGPDNESVLTRGTPGLLICDLWAHAYESRYGQRRAEYVEAFWHAVDWGAVGSRLDGIRAGRKQL